MKTILVMLQQKLSANQTLYLNESFRRLGLKPTYEYSLETLTEWSKDNDLKNSTKCVLVDCDAKNNRMQSLIRAQKESVFFYILPGKQNERKIDGGSYGFVRPTFDAMLELFENLAATHPDITSHILGKDSLLSMEEEEQEEDYPTVNTKEEPNGKILAFKSKEDFSPAEEVPNIQHEQQKEKVVHEEVMVEIETPIVSTTGFERKVQYQENPYHIRTRNIQRQLFSKQQWEDNRMIGLWSPLHRIGVTTFTLNFAFHLAENRIYTAVLEGLTEQHALKEWLTRYTHIPNKWKSYAKAIQQEEDPLNVEWRFRNVLFLPLDAEDISFEWSTESLESYMSTTKIVDVTLVDMPTGKMEKHTMDSLNYLDELWIVVDDSFQDLMSWKKYIQSLQKEMKAPIYLVMNKAYSFSQQKRLSKELQLPLLANLPAMQEEVMQNYYSTTPLYFNESVQEKLIEAFKPLTKHLLGKQFETTNVQDKQKSWLGKLLKPIN